LKRILPILLVLILGFQILPFNLICLAHPLGHDHHESEGESPCELRDQWKGIEDALFPPMNCDHFKIDQNSYEKPPTEPIGINKVLFPRFSTIIDAEIIFSSPFILKPDPKGNSDPPKVNYPLRGPPKV